MPLVNVGNDDASSTATSANGILGKYTWRRPIWLIGADLREELVRAGVTGVVLLLVGGLICLVLCPRSPPKMCDSEWAPHEGYCYKLLANKSFPAADHACRYENGAQLASIHSKAELEFVAMLSADQIHDDHLGAWIGLHRPAGARSTWKWLDGTALDFANWSDEDVETAPDNAATNQQWCVMIMNDYWKHHKQWIFRSCEKRGQSAVCKKEPGSSQY